MRAGLLGLALFVAASAWAGRAVVDWDSPYVDLRAGPGTDSPAQGRLSRGDEVDILEVRGDWAQVGFPGGRGWVTAQSLRGLAEPGAPPAGGPSAGTQREDARSGAVPEGKGDRPRRYLADVEQDSLPSYEPGSGLLSLFSGLLLVLALIAGLVYLLRRFSLQRFPGGRRYNAIQVLASRPVGPRQGLLLVEVGGLLWLLAQGPEGVRLIAEISDADALRRLGERYGFREEPFEAELRSRLEERGDSGDRGAPAEPTSEERLAALRRRPPTAGEP